MRINRSRRESPSSKARSGPATSSASARLGRAHHIAFWLGERQVLHATDRAGTGRVLEEPLDNARGDHEIRFVRL